MSELSDLALLGVCAGALVIIYLLRVLWGRAALESAPAPSVKVDKNAIIVDGSNVMHWGGDPSAVVLKRVIDSLRKKGFTPFVMFDANVGYKLEDRYMNDADMAWLIGLPANQVLVVGRGVVADEYVLEVASERGLRVVSNDRFRDWKPKYPMVGEKGRIVRGTCKGGGVQWVSL